MAARFPRANVRVAVNRIVRERSMKDQKEARKQASLVRLYVFCCSYKIIIIPKELSKRVFSHPTF